jgi:hypothetical protein
MDAVDTDRVVFCNTGWYFITHMNHGLFKNDQMRSLNVLTPLALTGSNSFTCYGYISLSPN